ncbi:MAG: hypothetical protein PVJ42_06615 [bacterium]|jgi:hypothetical protein
MELSGEWCDYKDRFDEIRALGATHAEQLAIAFGDLTRLIIEDSVRQVELARASQDGEEAVKQQIKLETMKHARGLFGTCYWHITGTRAWDEEE